MADIFSSLTSPQVGSKIVRKITLRTQFTPEVSLEPFAAGEPGAPPPPSGFSLMGFLKPEIIIDTAMGPVDSAPYGKPSNYFPLALIALGLMAVGSVVTIGYIARRMKKD